MSRYPAQVIKSLSFSVISLSLFCEALFGAFVGESIAGSSPGPQERGHANKPASASQQFELLEKRLQQLKPGVEKARQRSETVRTEAEALQHKLVDVAAQIQKLEENKARIETDILRLTSREAAMSAKFAHDKYRFSRLLAVLERLQADLPPPIALQQRDALAAARGAMVLGASLPQLYREAANLRRTLEALHTARINLATQHSQTMRNARTLAAAHRQLDQLLARKAREAATASNQYAAFEQKLEAIGAQATDLKALLARVSGLRAVAPNQDTQLIGRAGRSGLESLLRPVVGPTIQGGPEAVGGSDAPGLSFLASPGASVVAPADSRVLFAGPYHKSGQVLILEISDGYDLVLAGLDRIEVRPGDQLLTGEPVGRMPLEGNGAKLYFEMRQNGKSVSPARWLGIDLKKARRS